MRSFVIVCLCVLVYIKQRSRLRRQRVKQYAKRRQQEMNERRARGAKYPNSIDLTHPSCAEDTSDIQMIHCLSSDSGIVTDELYRDFIDGAAVWIPKKNKPSAPNSDSTKSSSITILSYIPSSQYSASKKDTRKTKKKSTKSRKHQQPQPLPREASTPASFCTPPAPKVKSPSKAGSPRLTKAGNYMICLTALSIIILFILYQFSTYIVYN